MVYGLCANGSQKLMVGHANVVAVASFKLAAWLHGCLLATGRGGVHLKRDALEE